ncbi:hypothetical protein LX64_03989 [Chitinophaga skermanii]|uniref:Uncharacterized protein n=1 Tax=Chitinophaga skermanii TaxID=331697 RepID=A0A327QF38_9BACT|nr:hypothetical protein [Chitinophaga skermanii]RAJ00287.1 hypothetical protein LX64_03989 [Chitinophaga skermanii]
MQPAITAKQHRGGFSNTTTTRQLPSNDIAIKLYNKAMERLLQVNNWGRISGKLSARFKLIDRNGKPVQRLAQEGDLIRIDLPAPGTIAGKGFDWVVIEKIQSQSKGGVNSIAMRVRPAPPADGHPQQHEPVAHFFQKYATSTFMVYRQYKSLTAGVFGRNEVPNVTSHRFIDQVRNFFVSITAILGLSKFQWKSLINGFLKN